MEISCGIVDPENTAYPFYLCATCGFSLLQGKLDDLNIFEATTLFCLMSWSCSEWCNNHACCATPKIACRACPTFSRLQRRLPFLGCQGGLVLWWLPHCRKCFGEQVYPSLIGLAKPRSHGENQGQSRSSWMHRQRYRLKLVGGFKHFFFFKPIWGW